MLKLRVMGNILLLPTLRYFEAHIKDTMKHKFTIIVLLLAFLFTHNISQALAPEVQLQDQPIKAIVTHFANEHGANPNVALAMMRCESQGNQNVAPGDGGRAVGLYQFHDETWRRLSKKYYGEVLDKHSGFDQAKVATAAIAGGDGDEWTTYRSIMNGGEYTFYSRLMKKTYTVKCKV